MDVQPTSSRGQHGGPRLAVLLEDQDATLGQVNSWPPSILRPEVASPCKIPIPSMSFPAQFARLNLQHCPEGSWNTHTHNCTCHSLGPGGSIQSKDWDGPMTGIHWSLHILYHPEVPGLSVNIFCWKQNDKLQSNTLYRWVPSSNEVVCAEWQRPMWCCVPSKITT